MPTAALRSVVLFAAVPALIGTADLYARQEQERIRTEAELKRYHAFVNAYRQGDDDSVNAILAWDPERLTEIVGAAQTPLDVFRPWEEERVKAAAMLHTDAAIRMLDGDESRLVFQLELAVRLLQMGGRDLHPFARTWYATVTSVLRDRARLFVAERLLERGRQRLPDDAVVLYESGVLQEQIATFAAFITEAAAPATPFLRSRSGGLPNLVDTPKTIVHRSVVERRRALESAAGWLRQSIKADPSSEPAQLHLGRVQVLRGNYGEASRLLQPLTASAVADTSYLATMFLGAMHDRRGHQDEAEQMYRRAIEKVPAAQSAYVALSEGLQRLGRGDESREVLMGLLRTPADTRTEPWWWYLAEPIGEARERLDTLRASVRK